MARRMASIASVYSGPSVRRRRSSGLSPADRTAAATSRRARKEFQGTEASRKRPNRPRAARARSFKRRLLAPGARVQRGRLHHPEVGEEADPLVPVGGAAIPPLVAGVAVGGEFLVLEGGGPVGGGLRVLEHLG